MLCDSETDPVLIGRQMAMLKVEASLCLEFCGRSASQIFGGNSYVRGGVGERVERIYRETRVLAIGGGSEEILTDLAGKMARL
jgi:alkylation response protein AidB-like acyl-CoA dehydrogenase